MTASLDDLATNGKLIVTQLGQIYTAINGIFRNVGTFTCAASASTTVTNVGVQANSYPILICLNAAAGTLQGSAKNLYISARVVGTSFTLTTASGGAAAGTEQFAYVLVTPT